MTPDRLKLAETLGEILAEENAALQRLDFGAAVALVPAKEQAFADLAAAAGGPLPPESSFSRPAPSDARGGELHAAGAGDCRANPYRRHHCPGRVPATGPDLRPQWSARSAYTPACIRLVGAGLTRVTVQSWR